MWVDRIEVTVHVRTPDRVFVGRRVTHNRSWPGGPFKPVERREEAEWMTVAEFAWRFTFRKEVE
jgi:hypothetical protein